MRYRHPLRRGPDHVLTAENETRAREALLEETRARSPQTGRYAAQVRDAEYESKWIVDGIPTI